MFLLGIFLRLGKERNKFLVAENHYYKETGGINSVQSSLKSHPLWITLYEHICISYALNFFHYQLFRIQTSIINFNLNIKILEQSLLSF